MILTAEKISFRYRRHGSTEILHQTDLSLCSGERVGLSAPSGRGKTTLCRLLAGYEKPDRGKILLDGKPLSSYRGFCPVQMIWQNPESAVDPLIPLGETLRESGAVEESLQNALHIQPHWLTRYPSELSGGELQRFCIARAMRPGLRFLLCDEMTAMLDFITQAQIWNFILEEAQRRNLGLLVVSHDPSLLEKVCTRIEYLPEENTPSSQKHGTANRIQI